MATLKEIAKEAGVSIMTVSNVINGNYAKVSKETISNVQEIIKKYNYSPNLNARSLAKRSSKIIAIFVNTYFEHENVFKDPYLSELFGEVECFIRSNGYYAIIQSVTDIENASTLLQNWNADGAIFLSPQKEADMNQLIDRNSCPIIFIDSYNKSRSDSLIVGIDDYKGGYLATKHLIENGHRKIGFAGYYSKENSVVSQRFEGYRAAMEEHGIPIQDSYLIHTLTTYEAGMDIGKDLANHRNGITAVFATADLLALGIMEGARLNGCMVPKDLSLVGFDNLELCSKITPKLTTVSQNVHNKAKTCVELLVNAIQKKELPNPRIICDVHLEVRETVKKLS